MACDQCKDIVGRIERSKVVSHVCAGCLEEVGPVDWAEIMLMYMQSNYMGCMEYEEFARKLGAYDQEKEN